jgi:hypothetical protein
VEDPGEILLPSNDSALVAFRVQCSRDHISSTLLDDLSLDLGHSPVVETFVSGPTSTHIAGFRSRCQVLDRPQHGLVKFIQSSPVQTPVEAFTYIDTGQSKLDVIIFL